jgi:hypothetical protein
MLARCAGQVLSQFDYRLYKLPVYSWSETGIFNKPIEKPETFFPRTSATLR